VPLFRIIRDFLANRDGNVAVITAFAILPMLVIAGGATDIARYEAFRAELQDGVDRGVLAAASLTQTRPVEATVRQYLKTVDFIDDVTLGFTHTGSTNVKQVRVTARYSMATAFLPLIGINNLEINVAATAIERRRNIEISLVLDISGSMREGNPTKISLLRPAANSFIDALVTSDTASYTSMSIVPYAGSVNPGAMVMDGIGVPRQHGYSSCVEFGANDYGVGLIPFNQRTQVPHFTYNHQNTPAAGNNALGRPYSGLRWSWCPEERTSVTYFSNNAATLKAKINDMEMHDGTGTAIAMNWGMMLLEPAAQPMVALAASYGMVPASFANRPAAFNDPNTLKFIVLMTDGEISDQYRPKQYEYPRACNAATNGSASTACTTIQMAKATAVTKMYAVCNRAKANGVTVFTIGFQVNSTSQTQMSTCASSASHFYNVSGLDIASAFRSIATSIQKIRLTE
jgi:Flp pilus assembly protein TadG